MVRALAMSGALAYLPIPTPPTLGIAIVGV
jgi:hypothetical protein